MHTEPFTLRKIAVAAFGPSLLFGLGEGAILPVIALSARNRGASVALAALIVTLIGIGSLLSNIPASMLTMRYGERRAIIGAGLWGAVAMVLCTVGDGIAALAIGVFMVGMAQSVFGLARQSYMTDAVPPHFRARALSLLGGVMRMGLFAGPFLAAAAIHVVGLGGAYWSGAAALLTAALLALRMAELPPLPAVDIAGGRGAPAAVPPAGALPGEPAPLGGRPPFARHAPVPGRIAPTIASVASRHLPIFLTVGIGVLLVSAVRASRQVVIPLWAEVVGLDAASTSLIYGVANAIEMVVFYPAGKLMDRRGRGWVAVPSMLIMGVGLALMPLAHGAAALLVAALLIGFGNGIGSGMVMILGADYSPSWGRTHFLGIWRLIGDIGSTAGPALLSGVTAAISLAAGIWSSALLAFGAAVVLGYSIPVADRRKVD